MFNTDKKKLLQFYQNRCNTSYNVCLELQNCRYSLYVIAKAILSVFDRETTLAVTFKVSVY